MNLLRPTGLGGLFKPQVLKIADGHKISEAKKVQPKIPGMPSIQNLWVLGLFVIDVYQFHPGA
jgi:hypothetical protein